MTRFCAPVKHRNEGWRVFFFRLFDVESGWISDSLKAQLDDSVFMIQSSGSTCCSGLRDDPSI